MITPQFVLLKCQFSLSAVMEISKSPATFDSTGYEYDHPLHFFTLLFGSIHNAVNKKGVFVLFHQTLGYVCLCTFNCK
jgi:hypothetical protein